MRGRPRRWRRIGCRPAAQGYKPQGVPARGLETVTLAAEELEALRLADAEGLGQDEAAERMTISQPTFHRTLKAARQKVADALLNGKLLVFRQEQAGEAEGEKNETGGENMPNRDGTGPEGKGPGTGRRRGRCFGNEKDDSPGQGRGLGRGLGRGMGRGRRQD